jgi:hypothetical protein
MFYVGIGYDKGFYSSENILKTSFMMYLALLFKHICI